MESISVTNDTNQNMLMGNIITENIFYPNQKKSMGSHIDNFDIIDSISVINNTNQNILMENILIMNQKKLLDLCIQNFDIIEKKSENNLTVDYVATQFDKLNFINWDLFLKLINLNTSFKDHYKGCKIQTKSLFYIADKNCYKLLTFLLKLRDNEIAWENAISPKFNIFHRIMSSRINQSDDLVIGILSKTKYGSDTIKQLLKNRDNRGKTPIDYFIQNCKETSILQALKSNYIWIDYNDVNSNNLVHWACARAQLELFDWLFTNGACMDKSNKWGKKPIHIACIKNNFQIVTTLLSMCKVNPNIMDGDCLKPIDYAVIHSDSKLVNYLIDCGIAIDDYDTFNDVVEYQNSKVIDYFLTNLPTHAGSSNVIWTLYKLIQKKHYNLMYKYFTLKLNTWLKNYEENMGDSFMEGYHID